MGSVNDPILLREALQKAIEALENFGEHGAAGYLAMVLSKFDDPKSTESPSDESSGV